MWHEARKQEKKIRGMIVDYRKRADRRKLFYERIVSFTFGLSCRCLLTQLALPESRSDTVSSIAWQEDENKLREFRSDRRVTHVRKWNRFLFPP